MSGRRLKLPLYRPVEGREQLKELRARGRIERRGLVLVLSCGAAVWAALVILNLATTGLDPELHLAARLWSVFPSLVIVLLLAPWATHQLWLWPRVLRTQARLIAHRHLLGRDTRTRALERRIAAQLDILSPPRPELIVALRATSVEKDRRLEAVLDAAVGDALAEETDHELAQRESRFAILGAYRIALGNFEIDVLLQPDFLDSSAAGLALDRAADLLESDASSAPSDESVSITSSC